MPAGRGVEASRGIGPGRGLAIAERPVSPGSYNGGNGHGHEPLVLLPFDLPSTVAAINSGCFNGYSRRESPQIPPTGVKVGPEFFVTNGVRSRKNLLIAERTDRGQIGVPESHIPDVRKPHRSHQSSLAADSLRRTPSGLFVPDSPDADRGPVRALPRGTEKYYKKGDPQQALDLDHPDFLAVDEYIDSRIESFVIRASERNKQLLEEKPFLTEYLTSRLEKRGENVTEEAILNELSRHMVEDKAEYRDEDGINFLPFDDIQPNDAVFNGIRFDWDTMMNVAAVLGSDLPDRIQVSQSSLRNAKYLMSIMGYVPNGAARAIDDTTQPDKHTRTIRMIYDKMTPAERDLPENKKFFREMFDDFAAREYWEVFNPQDPQLPDGYSSKDPLHQQLIVGGKLFTRYGSKDAAVYDVVSGRGSGHDFDITCYGNDAAYERVELMTDLYHVEEDLAWWAELNGDHDKASFYRGRMAQRAYHTIQTHYDPDTHWLYHFDIPNQELSRVAPVTGITALSMIKDEETRDLVITELEKRFVHAFGIGLTDPDTHPQAPSDEKLATIESHPGMRRKIIKDYDQGQWSGDNQFPTITRDVVDELMAVGITTGNIRLINLSIRIMEGVMTGFVRHAAIKKLIDGTHKVPEKINSRTGEMGTDALYGDQEELAMSFGVFKEFNELLPKAYTLRELAAQREQETQATTLYVAPRRSVREGNKENQALAA